MKAAIPVTTHPVKFSTIENNIKHNALITNPTLQIIIDFILVPPK